VLNQVTIKDGSNPNHWFPTFHVSVNLEETRLGALFTRVPKYSVSFIPKYNHQLESYQIHYAIKIIPMMKETIITEIEAVLFCPSVAIIAKSEIMLTTRKMQPNTRRIFCMSESNPPPYESSLLVATQPKIRNRGKQRHNVSNNLVYFIFTTLMHSHKLSNDQSSVAATICGKRTTN